MRLKGLKKAMSQRIAASPGLLCLISHLMATGFLPAVMLAQQSLAGGANLFALSRQAGEEIDAARALSLTQFYATEAPKTETAPRALVRSETATDYALPPGTQQPGSSITPEQRTMWTRLLLPSSSHFMVSLPQADGRCLPGPMAPVESPESVPLRG